MEIKKNIKIFATLILLFAVIFMCSSNAVFATDITNETAQNILDKIPNTIETKITFSTPNDYWNVPSPLEEIEREIESTVGDIQGISIETSFVQNDSNEIIDLSKINVSLYDNNHTALKSKTITVKWANWNESNKKRLESKLNNLKLNSKEYCISAELDVSKNEEPSPFVDNVAINHFNKLFNDSSIKCMLGSSSGDWGNGEYAIRNGQMFFAVDNVMYYMYPHLTVEGIPMVQKTDSKTNISLDTNTDVVPNDTILNVTEIKNGQSYNIITETLKNLSNKFVAYDITLKSNGVEIQPNGKVKISIPILSGYDVNKISVFRVEDNGTKIKYDTKISNNYAIIETDHFSNYVLAEENIVNTEETNKPAEPVKELEKDDTPKTGTVQYIGIAVIAIILSSMGIAALRNKKN